MKVYLDNCCYNRPYDDQDNIINRIFDYTIWQRDLYKDVSVEELYDKIKESEAN